MLSGVGNAEDLKAKGINVVHDLKGSRKKSSGSFGNLYSAGM